MSQAVPMPAGRARALRMQRAFAVARHCAAHVVLIAGAIFILLPFVWMLLTSIRAPAEILSGSLLSIPRTFYGVENYSAALKIAPLFSFMLNGVIVCAGILVVQLLVAIPAAYALAKLEFPGRGLLFGLVVAGLCVPIQVPALPRWLRSPAT